MARLPNSNSLRRHFHLLLSLLVITIAITSAHPHSAFGGPRGGAGGSRSSFAERRIPFRASAPTEAPPSSTSAGGGVEDDENFEFVVISDTHVGEGIPVYNSTALENYSTLHLRSAIARINELIAGGRPIRFVFITGDITSSAQPLEFQKARELFDTLAVPYFPLMGNHDTWTYDSVSEAPRPFGDTLFARTFASRFLESPWVRTYNIVPAENPEANCTSLFQNFVLQYGRLAFVGLDWNTRAHAIPQDKGCLPNAALHDIPGGTWPWFVDQLNNLRSSVAVNGGGGAGGSSGSIEQIVLLQHQPFRSFPLVPDFAFTFSNAEKAQVRALLDGGAGIPVGVFWGVMAGHLHRWFNGTAFDEPEFSGFRQWETDACKGQWNDRDISSAFTVVQVTDGRISNLDQLYGDDCAKCRTIGPDGGSDPMQTPYA